jgi:hypothetical protein
MVTQDSPRIEVLSRIETGWETRLYDSPDALLTLSSIGLSLSLTEIYA